LEITFLKEKRHYFREYLRNLRSRTFAFLCEYVRQVGVDFRVFSSVICSASAVILVSVDNGGK